MKLNMTLELFPKSKYENYYVFGQKSIKVYVKEQKLPITIPEKGYEAFYNQIPLTSLILLAPEKPFKCLIIYFQRNEKADIEYELFCNEKYKEVYNIIANHLKPKNKDVSKFVYLKSQDFISLLSEIKFLVSSDLWKFIESEILSNLINSSFMLTYEQIFITLFKKYNNLVNDYEKDNFLSILISFLLKMKNDNRILNFTEQKLDNNFINAIYTFINETMFAHPPLFKDTEYMVYLLLEYFFDLINNKKLIVKFYLQKNKLPKLLIDLEKVIKIPYLKTSLNKIIANFYENEKIVNSLFSPEVK